MKRTILFLLLAWIAIYAGNHLLFKSVSKNSEVETAVRLHHEEAREIDSWGPYLPGVRTKDDQEPNVTSTKAPLPSQKADANLRGDERIAENLATSDSSEEQVERVHLSRFPRLPIGSLTPLVLFPPILRQIEGQICVVERRRS